jgi:hypothetical protein
MMIYKMLPTIEGEPPVFARIDDDGLCRVTCVAENPEFQEYLKNGGELQDADGNVIDGNQFIKELP